MNTLLKNWPVKKEINNKTSSIEAEILNDYLPQSNWDRYFEKHLDIKQIL